MILTGNDIKEKIETGEIVISPFHPENVNPNSVNYHLGDTYIELSTDAVIDPKDPISFESKPIPASGLTLKPGRIYLCNTLEIIGSKTYVTSIIGRSSIGRLGLFLQVSADLGHQGEIHRWTLELKCVKPVIIYPRMTIGQITFWHTVGSAFEKEGFYTLFDLPTLSKGI